MSLRQSNLSAQARRCQPLQAAGGSLGPINGDAPARQAHDRDKPTLWIGSPV